jgi:protein ImuB
MARIGCIVVADFSIAAVVRANPGLADAVLVLARSTAAHAEIDCVSPRARALGVRAGMTLAQARAISSALVPAAPSPAAERSAAAALADAAESVSPVVEPGESGCVWLDLAGLERLYGGEEEIAAEIIRRVRRVGMEAAVGIAAGRELANLAARCGGARCVPAGREREFIDWLPLDMLALGAAPGGEELEVRLKRWGLRRLGDLARLDPDAIGSRLGRRGTELVRIARGAPSRPIAARTRTEVFAEAVELDYGIDNLEPLGFVLRAALERLAARLSLRGFAGGDILLALGLVDHRVASRRVAVAAPTCDARAMLALVMLALEAAAPEAAVETIRIEITPRAPRPAQADMFLPPAPAPDKLATALARLAAMCGPDHVGALAPENSHRPDAMRIAPFDPPAPTDCASPSGRGRARPNAASGRAGEGPVCAAGAARGVAKLVIRTLRPALEVEVMCSRGGPEFVRGPNLAARVVSAAGPWRRDGEWWKTGGDERLAEEAEHNDGRAPYDCASPAGRGRAYPSEAKERAGEGEPPQDPATAPSPARQGEYAKKETTLTRDSFSGRSASQGARSIMEAERLEESAAGFVRDYYELALDDGGVYRVFRDARAHRWFVDGVYD